MDYIKEFNNELERVGKSKNTKESYLKDVRKFIDWFNKTYNKEFAGVIHSQDIDSYSLYLKNMYAYKATTVIRKLNSLKAFNNYLIQYCGGKDIKFNYLKNGDIIKQNNKILTEQELMKLKDTIYRKDNKRDIVIYEILLNTGISVSELINISLDDIVINNDSEDKKSYIMTKDGKGNPPKEIKLNSITQKAILDYLAVRPIYKGSKKLLLGQRGPITRYTIVKILHEYSKQAEIQPVSPQMLRYVNLFISSR